MGNRVKLWLRTTGLMLHLMCVAVVGSAQAAVNENDPIGTWKLSFNPGDGESESTLTITRAESDLKGEFVRGEGKFKVTSITFQDGSLTFSTESQRDGQPSKATFDGKVEADTIKGDASWEYNGQSGSFSFTGSREEKKASAEAPSLVLVPGKPNLTGAFDLSDLGYEVQEFFVSGTATSYKLAGEATVDGKWDALPATNAPYTTRIVVVRPKDAGKFSGTAVVEWLNVSGGLDVPVDWNIAHREILRRGHAYVAVSAQKVGIDGNPMTQGAGRAALKKADPARYGRLNHPGDAFAFDIFSQAGALVKNTATSKILGPLVPKRVLAVGESQSAFFLTTYVTAVDPVARVYDGFLIHSRSGTAAPVDGNPFALFTGSGPVPRLRPDLRVPVITVITETDLLGFGPLKGFSEARQPDTDKLRVWEIAGSAHADNYVFSVGFIDTGSLPIEKLAAAFAPTSDMFGQRLPQPMNFGPQHHYVTEAALWQLDRWIKTGEAAPKGTELKLTQDKPPKLVTDANGNAEGGIRTPWVDVPTAVLSGAGGLAGFGKPFDSATLGRLYPGGSKEYLRKFEASLDECIKTGFILPEDKSEILGIATVSFGTESKTAGSSGASDGAADPSSATVSPIALVDKAVRALGGAEKMAQVRAATWKEKGTLAYQGNDIPINAEVLVQGTDHMRREWEVGFGGMKVRGVAVVTGEGAWSKMMENAEELAGEKLADERRKVYLTVIPVTVLPLKSEGHRLAAIADEQVGERPAAGLKVTPPDGKEFRLYFDKETGLPVRVVAKVLGQGGAGECTEETTYSDYKAFDDVQKATKISIKRDGAKVSDVQISEFKVLDRADAKAFAKLSSSQPAGVPAGIQAQGTTPKPRPITDPKVAHEALPDHKFNVYYPRDIMERKTPVPVISWGNGGCMTFDWMSTTLLERWAAAGFAVVTYNDPAGNNKSAGVDALTEAQVQMLDWAEKANAEGGRFAGKLDTERMVVGGNSCGGITAFKAAWADKRPKAIFIVSGSAEFPGVTDEVRKASAGRVQIADPLHRRRS